MAMVAAKCTMCGSSIKVDDTKEKGICEHCGTEFITEKVINVTNITNVDKSTNIYYGETTDAKVKKDLEKIYKSLVAAGFDLDNLKVKEDDLDVELCQNAYTLAKGVIKKDPTNYSAWKSIVIMYYASCFAGDCEWLYGVEKFEKYTDIVQRLLKDISTAKKIAPDDEESKFLDTLRDNIKINYYQTNLKSASTGKNVAERVTYLEKPEKKKKLHKALIWVGAYVILMGLLLLVNNVANLKLSFIPENMTGENATTMVIMLIACGLILIGVYVGRIISIKNTDKKIANVESENKKRFTEKSNEIEQEIASAKTVKEYEALADKYGVPRL